MIKELTFSAKRLGSIRPPRIDLSVQWCNLVLYAKAVTGVEGKRTEREQSQKKKMIRKTLLR
jgi:hypothetical protein